MVGAERPFRLTSIRTAFQLGLWRAPGLGPPDARVQGKTNIHDVTRGRLVDGNETGSRHSSGTRGFPRGTAGAEGGRGLADESGPARAIRCQGMSAPSPRSIASEVIALPARGDPQGYAGTGSGCAGRREACRPSLLVDILVGSEVLAVSWR